ncbi:B12-binding domain-containing radical SAM protein [Flavihumibacter solisilvae]|uniref:Radical SAM protein n=1 Tax=Flavihumibacter solisilvae TaxID=1349421 RepID=A0A0C1IMC3_9BACT|nr:radical SAM protein [Flavihumibacter solisilvae]KIC95405.1 radical SAM protein [Flavihumibacter solisilvae]
MEKLNIGIIDLVAKCPTNTLWARIMHANLASIMPQVVAAWCEEEGHQVTFVCFTGREDLQKIFSQKMDLVFISSFTHAALLAYALSNYFRSRGAVTVLGGPHARCYADDAARYFDYVLGFTHKTTITDLLNRYAPQRPIGEQVSASKQPVTLPGIKQRWKFIEQTLAKAPFIKIVPMLASMGCPYTCSFCIDAAVPYQAVEGRQIKEDLEFLLTKFRKPFIVWHDPNFGVKFHENMEAIRTAAPPGSFRFIAESSLSILTKEHLEIMKSNGMEAMLPGIESWYELGYKAGTGRTTGIDKVYQVAEHVNTIFRYIPYVQANFVLGLDSDEGEEPFELTKRFIDKCPAAFPGYSLLSAFGTAAQANLEYQQSGRVLPFPFHFLNNHLAMNVSPKNYKWPDFYDKVIDLTEYSFSPEAIYCRFMASKNYTSTWMNLMRAMSSEGYGRIRFYRKVRKLLSTDRQFRQYFEGETTQLPSFYRNIIRHDLGEWNAWLPDSALEHDPNNYLRKSSLPELSVS